MKSTKFSEYTTGLEVKEVLGHVTTAQLRCTVQCACAASAQTPFLQWKQTMVCSSSIIDFIRCEVKQ